MDFFKGIGDWFGGLFGKKKKEEEQRPVMQQPTPQPQRPQMPQGMDFGFNPMAKPVAKTVYNKYGQPMSVMERPKWNDNPFQVAKPQQNALNEQKPLNQNVFNTPKPPEPKKPSFFDYLNPLGEHGLFGAKQQQNFKNAIKPVNDVLQGYEKWVDSSDKQEGFQWNDLGDYGRFIGKLPTGMVSGVVNAPEKIGQSISGVRNNDKGEVERLNLLQRGATALDAGIDIGGLGFGGSGTLLKAFGKEATEQATKKGAKQLIKGIAKDALEEGLEEGAQTFLGDLSDDGKLNTNLSQYAQSVALGALGGGVMSGIGKAIGGAKQAYNQAPITKLNQYVTNNPVLLDQMVSQAKTQARQDIDTQYSRQTQPVQNALAKVMADRQIDEAMKFKLASDEHGRYVEIERNTESQQQFNDLSRNELAKQARVAEYYDSDANKKGNNLAPDGFDYYDSRFKDNGRNFINRYNIAKNNKLDTNTIYGATTFPADENWQITELDNKKTPGTPSLVDETTPLGSVPEVSNSNIAQSDENVNLNSAYDPINNQIISYSQQDISNIQKLHQQYGNDFTEHLNQTQEAIYNHLLDQAPRDQQGRYQDPITGEVWIDEIISRDDGSQYVRVDNKIVNDYDDNSLIRQKIKQTIAEKFQGNQYQVGDTDILARVTGKTKNELSYKQRHMNDGDYRHKANMAGNLDEILNTMIDVRIVPNKKVTQKPYVDHYISGRTEVEIDGHLYYPRVDIEVSKNGQIIAYDIADIRSIKKEPRAEADNRSYMRETNSALDNQGSVSDGNIAQPDQNVNDGVKFKLSPEQEAFFKDSKVRDENGELLPVYHGTNTDFNQFDKNKIGKGLGRNPYVDGFWFSSNKSYAKDAGKNTKVTYLDIKNPYIIDGFSAEYQQIASDAQKLGISITERLQQLGYDGAKDGDSYVAFEPSQIKYIDNLNPTNSPDMRYKISEKSAEIKSSIDELKARHFQLTGDNDIAFNAFAEAIQDIGNIEGYYDPKTNTVHIGELAEYVLNHEVVHKTLRKHMELRPEIMQATADKFGIENIIREYNEKGYGANAVNGHALDPKQPKDVRLAVEEKVADEFNSYLEQYQKGRANYYANKVGLTPTIRAWFDRIIEGLKDFFGQADKIKQFYAQLETGKFSTDDNIGVLERTVSRLEDSIAYKRNPDAAKRALAGFNMVKNGWRKQATLTQLTADSAERYRQATGLAVSDNAKLVLTNDTINHLRNSGHLTGEGVRGRIDRNPLTDADIANIHEVFNNPDEIKLIGDGRLGKRISVSKTISKNHRLGVDLISDGTDFYVVTYFNKSRSPQQMQASSSEGVTELNPLRPRPERSSEAYADNIPQTDENIKYKLDDDVDDYVKQQVKAQKQAIKTPFKEKIVNALDYAKHWLVDDAVAYERQLKQAVKDGKLSKIEAESLKQEIRNNIDSVRASEMIAQQFIKDSGLSKLGKLSTEELNQFQQYLIARRHAADLHKRGIKTGRDLDADLAIIKQFKNKFKHQEKVYREFNKKLLGYMKDNGLISKKSHNSLIKNNDSYAPFQRLMDDVSGFTGHSQQLGNLSSEQVIKGIKGSERTILNPLESTMINAMRIINEGNRNIAARQIAEQIYGQEYRLRQGQKPRAGYDTINFIDNGKKVSYEVPKLVAEEMKRLNRILPDGVDKIIKTLALPAKTLRAGATSLNPTFAASNLIRDQLTTMLTGSAWNNLKGTPKAFLATFGLSQKASSELKRVGVIGSEYRQTYGYKQGDLMKELQKEHQLPRKAWDRLRHLIDGLNDLIGLTEYFTRAQQYFGTDGDIATKAQAARNNTLNFSRGGSAVMVANKIVPFLNAGVQGGRQVANQLIKRPVHTVSVLTAFGLIAYAAKGANSGDEEKKELYNRIGEHEKRTNIIVFKEGAHYDPKTNRVEGVIKIPIPQFVYPITDSVNNLKGKPEDFMRVAGNLLEVFSGIDVNNPVNQLTPTAIKPFIEQGFNRNSFTGRELVSEYDKNLNPEDKGAKYTTGIARQLAKLTGVDAPVIDNFIQNWSGGLGKDLAKSLTDNPDNQADGGGIKRMLGEGVNRRFLSAGVTSQYQIADEQANYFKQAIKNTSEFKKLSLDDQRKVLNTVDSDLTNIARNKNKLERGEERKKDISERQSDLLQGLGAKDYLSRVLIGERKINKEKLYSQSDAEYNEFKKDYDKKLAKGEYSRRGKIEADKKLKTLEAGKDFPKEIRDLYGLSGEELRELVTTSQDGQYVLDEVLKYDDKLVSAGLIKSNKFRDKYGKLNIGERVERGSRGRRVSTNIPNVHTISTDMLLKGLRESKTGGKFQTVKSYNIGRGKRIRNLQRLNGGRTVSLKKQRV